MVCPSGKPSPCARTCPPQTGFPGEKFGLHVNGVVFGHFLAPGSIDAAVSVSGCEPHANLFGGTYLLSKRDTRWRLMWYRGGVPTGHCHLVAAKDRRDRLVCLEEFGGQGNVFTWIFMQDLAHPIEFGDGQRLTKVFEVYDSQYACGGVEDPPQLRAYREEIQRVEFDASGMTVTALHGFRRMAQAEIDRCVQGHPMSIATRIYKIEFLFDGFRYRVAPSSRPALAVFEKK